LLRLEMLRRLVSHRREDWGLTKRRRGVDYGITSPAFALSPSKRAKHLDVASSALAEGRSGLILADFGITDDLGSLFQTRELSGQIDGAPVY
jgi:hypothetical protein